MALPWSRKALRAYGAVAALVVVITGMAVWGIHERHSEPQWYVGQHLSRRQARGVLQDAIAGLHTARLAARVSGEVPVRLRGSVDYTHPRPAASLATLTLTKPHRHVPLVVRGKHAYLHLRVGDHTGWVGLAVDSHASGYVRTTVSQIAAGIDLPRLFASAEKGVRTAIYEGPQSTGRLSGNVFEMRIDARAVRRLLPSPPTRDSSRLRTVVATFVLDPQGRLLRFWTVMGHDAVEVGVTRRNPPVRLAGPAGPVVSYASVARYL